MREKKLASLEAMLVPKYDQLTVVKKKRNRKEGEEEVDKVEEEEEGSNLGKSDDQRACLPKPPALLLGHKI